MQAVAKLSVDNDYQRMQLVSNLTKLVITVIADRESFQAWEPEKRAALAKAYRLVISNRNQDHFAHDVHHSTIMIHVATGQVDALEQWAKENKESLELGQRYVHPSSILSQLNRLVPKRDAENLSVRLMYLGRCVRALHALGHITMSEPSEKPATIQLKNAGSLFSSLTNYGFLQRDDLVKNADAVAKEELGYVWAAIALAAERQRPGSRAPRGRAKLPDAEAAWRKAIESARTDELEMRFRLELARLLKSKDRIEDARNVVQEKKEVPKSLEKAVETFMKSLSDAKADSKSAVRRPLRAGTGRRVTAGQGRSISLASGSVRQTRRIGFGPNRSVESHPEHTVC